MEERQCLNLDDLPSKLCGRDAVRLGTSPRGPTPSLAGIVASSEKIRVSWIMIPILSRALIPVLLKSRKKGPGLERLKWLKS